MPPINKKPTTPGQTATAERRRTLRFPFTASVETIETESGVRISGRTSDLSLGGCYVDTIAPFPVGTETTVRITKGQESFEVKAKVVYSKIGMGMGIEFASTQVVQDQLFQKWIRESSGEVVVSAPALPLAPAAPAKVEHQESGAANSAPAEKNPVLRELLQVLMRKGVLSEEEGKGLLKKIPQ